MALQFQLYNFQRERMSGEAIPVDRATYGFKLDRCHVNKQLRLRLPLKASAAQFQVYFKNTCKISDFI